MITLEQAIDGVRDAEDKLSTREATVSPSIISEQMYRLGQYTSALEKHLGDAEQEYEVKWAEAYKLYTMPYPVSDEKGKISTVKAMSATAAENQANVDCAADKGNIKRLSRYVSSAWKVHTGAMARVNHLQSEARGSM